MLSPTPSISHTDLCLELTTYLSVLDALNGWYRSQQKRAWTSTGTEM